MVAIRHLTFRHFRRNDHPLAARSYLRACPARWNVSTARGVGGGRAAVHIAADQIEWWVRRRQARNGPRDGITSVAERDTGLALLIPQVQ